MSRLLLNYTKRTNTSFCNLLTHSSSNNEIALTLDSAQLTPSQAYLEKRSNSSIQTNATTTTTNSMMTSSSGDGGGGGSTERRKPPPTSDEYGKNQSEESFITEETHQDHTYQITLKKV